MGTFKEPAKAKTESKADAADAKDNAAETKTDAAADAKDAAPATGADGRVNTADATANATAGEQPTKEEIAAEEEAKVNQAKEEGGEAAAEEADELIASRELPVEELTPPETQADTAAAEDAKELIVPGAAEGPDVAGVVRNHEGNVAYAPPGTLNAAYNGVQEDAAGHVDSMGTDNSSKSGTRV